MIENFKDYKPGLKSADALNFLFIAGLMIIPAT